MSYSTETTEAQKALVIYLPFEDISYRSLTLLALQLMAERWMAAS